MVGPMRKSSGGRPPAPANLAGKPSSSPDPDEDLSSENEDVDQNDSDAGSNTNENKPSPKNKESGDASDKSEEAENEPPPKQAKIDKPKQVIFECSMCFFTTDTDENFSKHMEELHRRDLGYWCKACGTAYEAANLLIEHIREYCDKVKHYVHACGFADCEFKTPDPANLIFHFRNEHKGKYLFPCGQCEQQFTILTSLVLHQQDKCVNKEKCLVVPTGDQPKATKEPEKKKDKTKTDSRFRCALCTFEAIDRSVFVDHHADLHSRDLCCCKRCGKVYKNADGLVKHIEDSNCSPNRYDHPCGADNCEFTTHDPLAFRNHIRNGHAKTSLQKCKGCKKQFTIIPLLLMHIQDECPELNTEGREAPSNGNSTTDTINLGRVGNDAATTAPATRGRGAKKEAAAKKGRGSGSARGRGKGSRGGAGGARSAPKRSRSGREKTPHSSDESEADDPPPAPTPTRTSSRAAAKKVSYANSDNSDDDY